MTPTMTMEMPALESDFVREMRIMRTENVQFRKLCPKCRTLLHLSESECGGCGLLVGKKPAKSASEEFQAICVRAASCALLLGSLVFTAAQYL